MDLTVCHKHIEAKWRQQIIVERNMNLAVSRVLIQALIYITSDVIFFHTLFNWLHTAVTVSYTADCY